MTHGKNTTVIGIRIPDSHKAILQERAEEIGVAISDYLKAIIDMEVSKGACADAMRRGHRIETTKGTQQRTAGLEITRERTADQPMTRTTSVGDVVVVPGKQTQGVNGNKSDALAAEIKHGTMRGYSTHGCRCEACKKAHADINRRYRERKRQGKVKATADAKARKSTSRR